MPCQRMIHPIILIKINFFRRDRLAKANGHSIQTAEMNAAKERH